MPLSTKKQTDSDDLTLFPQTADLAGFDETWFQAYAEGQLAVDVYETDREIMLRSAIAGVKPENLEVFVQNDMLTIRGERREEGVAESGHYVVRECHWGSFSRSVILPAEVDPERITATLKDGILTVRLPKIERSKKIAVKEL